MACSLGICNFDWCFFYSDVLTAGVCIDDSNGESVSFSLWFISVEMLLPVQLLAVYS